MRRIWAAVAFLAAAASAHAQSMSAREIYYGENRRDTAKPSDAAKLPVRARKKTPTPPAATPAPARDDVGTTPVPDQAAVRTTPHPQFVDAAYRPLGLKYTIEKRDSEDRWNEVDQDQTFTKGDAVRLVIETNDPGYLYVVSQGSSKKWDPRFPPPDQPDVTNRVEAGQRYTIPKTAFIFDAQPGIEKLFVILSRQPVDPEHLIYSLDDRKDPQKKKPATELPQVIMASLRDDQVSQLRNTYSRDLIIEDEGKTPHPQAKEAKESKAAAPSAMEKSVYVVNPKGAGDARVVADIQLRHQ